jgi:hypothetical protein
VVVVGSVLAGLICVDAALWPALGAGALASAIFSPDSNTGWVPDRRTGGAFLPLTATWIAGPNKPSSEAWAVDRLRNTYDRVLAEKVPFSPPEWCSPGGVPNSDIYARVAPIYSLQTPKEVTIVIELDHQVRHVYLNAPHSAHVTPSWYGQSVGH